MALQCSRKIVQHYSGIMRYMTCHVDGRTQSRSLQILWRHQRSVSSQCNTHFMNEVVRSLFAYRPANGPWSRVNMLEFWLLPSTNVKGSPRSVAQFVMKFPQHKWTHRNAYCTYVYAYARTHSRTYARIHTNCSGAKRINLFEQQSEKNARISLAERFVVDSVCHALKIWSFLSSIKGRVELLHCIIIWWIPAVTTICTNSIVRWEQTQSQKRHFSWLNMYAIISLLYCSSILNIKSTLMTA